VGFNMSWVCVDGIKPEALALDLAPTGEIPDLSDLGLSDTPWAGATLKSGWCAVFASHEAALGLPIPRLPAHCWHVVCSVMEIVTISASLWQGGRQIWNIVHQGNRNLGITDLEASGDLPPEFAAIRDIAVDKARTTTPDDEWTGTPVFDVPIDTAAVITGLRREEGFFSNLRTLAPVDEA
jgi:hypothetical protein